MSDTIQNMVYKTAKVEVVDKKMRVFLILKDSNPESGVPLTIEAIKDILDTASVKFGIKDDVIKDIVEGVINDDKVLIAEGNYPTAGEDASLAFNFPIEKSAKPQFLEDGHLDYKEINMVYSVEKDVPLVKKIHATIGSRGMDVYGNDLPGLPGKDIDVVVGQGTLRDHTDTSVVKSAIDGVIFYDPKSRNLEVQKLFIVPESVDYSTGNIHVKSSVEVKQDVKPGFSIETPYNVEVKGSVEHAAISCDGTLKVKGGINGDGKLLIKVGEELHAGYIAGQNIKCAGCIYVAHELRNSIVECEDEVTIVRNNGVIFGGRTSATNKVTSPVIGNIYGLITEIEVGVVMKFREKFIRKGTERSELLNQLEELKRKISLIAQKSSGKSKSMQLSAFKDVWSRCTNQLERVKKECEEIEKAYYDVADPTVVVIKTVYPGTIIKIKNKSLEVKEELSHVLFKLVDDLITYSKIK